MVLIEVVVFVLFLLQNYIPCLNYLSLKTAWWVKSQSHILKAGSILSIMGNEVAFLIGES